MSQLFVWVWCLTVCSNSYNLCVCVCASSQSLKWLDLKDNPLEPDLAKAAGDCLDEKQCKQCASKVLQHMRAIQEDVDRAREKRLLREKEEKRQTSCASIFALSPHNSPHELLPVAEEVNSKETGETRVLLLILEELKELQKTVNLLLSSRDGGGMTEDWITRINRVFFIFYVIIVVLFLSFMCKEWSS